LIKSKEESFEISRWQARNVTVNRKESDLSLHGRSAKIENDGRAILTDSKKVTRSAEDG
jgi:hypothetical protein